MGLDESIGMSEDDNYGYKALGPVSEDYIIKADRYSASNYSPYPFVVDEAQGAWLYDPDGNKAIDFLSAYSAILEHRHPGVIKEVMDEMVNGSDLVSRALYSSQFSRFTEELSIATGYDRVLPKSDGGSATDSAISGLLMHGYEQGKLSPEVILTKDYFHGRTWIFASNADFDPEQSGRRVPRARGIKVVDDDSQSIEDAINENTVGIFIETHKGEGGPLFSTRDKFMKIKNLADENSLFFGADEIQTGLGRCGYLMAWQEYGEEARPDFVTLGKALGAGIIPVSAVVGSERFMEIYTPGSDGSTYGGYPLACAAARASLRYIQEEGIFQRSKEMGDYFVKKLSGVPGINVENRGLLIRVEIKGERSARPYCLEMLLGRDKDPRVFMKHGHYDAEKDVAYTRIAPPPGVVDEKLIDEALEKTVIPVLASRI